MKLIVIYGPPATGKYTIAKEIAKKTRYRILHNHDFIDPLFKVLDKNSKTFWKFYKKLKSYVIEEAIKEGVKGMITTYAYTGKEKDFMRSLIRLSKKYKSALYMIKLECDYRELEKRINNKDRLKYGKEKTKKGLKKWFKDHEPSRLYPYKNTLVLNTTRLSAKKAAEKIIKFCKIKTPS